MNDRSHNLLLVEDEALIAINQKQQLEKIGYSVDHVVTGESAVSYTLHPETRPDLVLMDIDLGKGIDGTQAAEQILTKIDIPIVFLSSHTDPKVVEKTEKITSYGYVVKNSGITVLDASIKMAFKLYAANQKLQNELKQRNSIKKALEDSEIRFRALFEKAPVGVAYHRMVYDDTGKAIDYRFLDANESYLELTGVDPRGRLATEVFPGIENDPSDWIGTFGHVAKTGEQLRCDQYLQPNDRWYDCVSYQVKPDHFVAAFVEITDRKKAEEQLRARERLLQTILDNSVDLIALMGFDGTINHVSKSVTLLGYDLQSLIGTSYLPYLHPDDREPAAEALRTISEFAGHRCGEYRLRRANGEYALVESQETVLRDTDGNPRQLLVIARDITERKRVEEEIQRQLAEKETVLKEVHHRIKNNMAQVESLLSIQADNTESAEATSLLQEASSRLRSTRTLYEKLLIGKGYEEVSMKDYLESLIDSLLEVYNDHPGVTVEKHIDDFSFSAKRAVPVGIILNELLTNVFKYAFGNRAEGRVMISLEKTANRAVLTVQDDGIGFDERVAANKSTGFGLTLTKMLAEQLNGTFTIENDHGTKTVVTFNV